MQHVCPGKAFEPSFHHDGKTDVEGSWQGDLLARSEYSLCKLTPHLQDNNSN